MFSIDDLCIEYKLDRDLVYKNFNLIYEYNKSRFAESILYGVCLKFTDDWCKGYVSTIKY